MYNNNPYQNFGYMGYNTPNYAPPTYNAQPQPPQQIPPQTNTNKIYVSGIDDVRGRFFPPNSDYIFLDNDKPILYQKVVDSKGQFEVKAFTITPYSAQESQSQIDMSGYAKQEQIEALRQEINAIKDKITPKQVTNNVAK